jgi:hypothetical protein
MGGKQDSRVDRILDLPQRRQQLSLEARRSIRQANIRRAQQELEKQLLLSGLPEESKARIRTAFTGTDLGGLRQALNVERRKVCR